MPQPKMNSTSFTSIDSACISTDKMVAIDCSSTASLTMNSSTRLHPISTSCCNSDNSDNDNNSPSVTVVTSSTSAPRPSLLLANSCPLTRSNKTKYQRSIWSRSSPFERLLILLSTFFASTTTALLLILISVLVSHRYQDNNRQTDQQTQEILNQIETQPEYCLTPSCITVAANIINAIDTTVEPCDDFYMYSCGDWIKSNPLPEGKSSWGTFGKLWQENQLIMKNVLENDEFKPGSAEEKTKIYYLSCLDRNETIENRGAKPMQDLIESSGGWNISGAFNLKEWDLQRSLQIYHNQYNRGGLFSWAVGADERNSTRNVIQLDQSGLGLPNRDYYLNKTDKNTVLEAYLTYMNKVATLMGASNTSDQMKEVLEFETKLAAITVPADQRRDDERMYHKFTLRELSAKAPFLNWTKYFDDAFDYHSRTDISYTVGSSKNLNDSINNNTNDTSGFKSSVHRHIVTEDEHVVIYSPEYFDDLSKLVTEQLKTDKGKVTLANYLAWSVIQSLIATLPKQFREASKILRRALIGSEGQEITWRFCVSDTNGVMGFATGSMFVRSVFDGGSKEKAEEMIDSIRAAFKDHLSNLNWMDENTRRLAEEKADKINEMIGFPDFILNPEKLDEKYKDLHFDEDTYFENNIKVNVYSLRENMEKINKLANKTEWEMSPPTVNAYYTPTKNQIVFPAGILQTPFYDASYPHSLNFGAMGVVMGHELTHAFDDQGREYDKDGNLHPWWFNTTLKNFEERVKCFVDQYSTYEIEDDHLNGKQTLGENIADNGGLKAAFRAFEGWLKTHHEAPLPGLNLTSKQLFFIGFAQVWCSTSTPEALKLQIVNDPHAPAQYRVIGTLSNSQEFAREFNCPVNSRMNPDKKCVVW